MFLRFGVTCNNPKACILQKIYSRALKKYLCVVFEISNFTNESSKKYYNECQNLWIQSTLININFFKICQKITTENFFKISLVFNEIYREKIKKIDVLLTCKCTCKYLSSECTEQKII